MSTVELRRMPAQKVRRLRKVLDALTRKKETKPRSYDRVLKEWKKTCDLVFGGF